MPKKTKAHGENKTKLVDLLCKQTGLSVAVVEKELGKALSAFEDNEPFRGQIKIDIEKKKFAVRVLPKHAKTKMMSIYAGYSDYFESKRTEYIRMRNSAYGAEKYAVDETIREIFDREKIRVTATNLKQAMTRIFDRKPTRSRKED